MMRSVFVVVIIADVLLTSSAAKSSAAAPSTTTPSPTTTVAPLPITYYCNSTTTLLHYDLSGLTTKFANFSYAIARPSTNLSLLLPTKPVGDCLQTFTNVTAGGHDVPCSHLPIDKEMVLYLMKKNVASKHILGGPSFEKIPLPCDITDGTVIKVNDQLLKLSGTTTTQKPPIPDLVVMKVTKPDSTPVSKIFIGELLKVDISVNTAHIESSSHHFLALESCSAKPAKSTANPTPTIELYKYVTPLIIEKDIMSKTGIRVISQTSNDPIGFQFYAFRFAESDSVLLECQIKVCTTSTPCQQTDLSLRRRRSANDKYNTASATFEVDDKAKEVKSGQQRNLPMLTVISAGLMLLYAMFQ